MPPRRPSARGRRRTYLRHAVEELDQLAPEEGEERRLAETRDLLMHREKLIEAIQQGVAALEGDSGADRAVGQAQRVLQRIADKAGGRLDPVLETLDRAAAELTEALGQLQSIGADIDLDAAELERLEERLFTLRQAGAQARAGGRRTAGPGARTWPGGWR